MKIICAGFPKTGTKSMALALRELGYSVYDFEEQIELFLDKYLDFFEGRVGSEVFLEMYNDVDVVVDQPACNIWNILRGHFPDAKVILMERDSSLSWVKSYTGMLTYYAEHHLPMFHYLRPWLSKTHAKIDKFSLQCLVQSTASTDLTCHYDTELVCCLPLGGLDIGLMQWLLPGDTKNCCQIKHQSANSLWNPIDISHDRSSVCLPLWQDQYIKHNAAVKALVDPEQLLVYQVGEGWDRLCAFLGKDVPATEFPYENKGGKAGNIADQVVEFGVYQKADREVKWSLCKIAAFTSLAVLAGWKVYSGRWGGQH